MSSKKEQEVTGPIVTSLPLPSSDSVLVIDLPDGQKLLVGKMEHGTVIEVATWRGTGRPDSRTNRLMLGMSNGDADQISEKSAQEAQEVVDKRSIQYWLWVLKNITVNLKSILLNQAKFLKGKIKKSDTQNSSSEVDVKVDVDAWIDSIIKKNDTKALSENSTAKRSISTPQAKKKSVGVRKSPSRK